MTEQIITITGLEFTTEGRPIAHGAIIREGAGALEETMKAGGAQMGTLSFRALSRESSTK